MTANDYNTIKPTQHLPVLTGPASTRDRPQKGKKNRSMNKNTQMNGPDDKLEEESIAEESDRPLSMNDSGEHKIDYCA